MRVFLTGGHGFFGRRLAEALRAHAFEVVAPSHREVDLLEPAFALPTFRIHLSQAMRGCEVVVHAAADVGGLKYVSENGLEVAARNLQMSLNLLRAARDLNRDRAAPGIKIMVTVGSACSYPVADDGQSTLGHEEDFWRGRPHESVESYGGYKRTLELLARLEPSWTPLHLPLASLYGPGDANLGPRAHVLTALVEKVVRAKRAGASQIEAWAPDTEREMMYVDDAADAAAEVIGRYANGLRVDDDIVNIGTGACHRIDHLLLSVQQAAGTALEVRWNPAAPRGVRRKVLDVERLRSVWKKPLVSLKDGIACTVEAFERDLPP